MRSKSNLNEEKAEKTMTLVRIDAELQKYRADKAVSAAKLAKAKASYERYYYASVCGKRVGRTSLYDDFLKRFFPKLVDNDSITEETDAIEVVNTIGTILKEVKT